VAGAVGVSSPSGSCSGCTTPYTSAELTTRTVGGRSNVRAAASSSAVPMTLTRRTWLGFSQLSPTWVMAARW
jgi:hypothetical protein